MPEQVTAENLDSVGLEYAAKNSRYLSSKCIQLSTYSYKKNTSTNVDNNVYLKGANKSMGNGFNGLNHNTKYTYWGRAIEEDEQYVIEQSKEYISGFGNKNSANKYVLIPLVYKNNGLIPIPDTSPNASYPYIVNTSFTSTKYLKYDPVDDSCKYSTSENGGTWTFLNYGPGVFFLMCGGGGGGGNASTTFFIFGAEGAGGGGGGGGSVFGYIDLRMIGKVVRVTLGDAGIGGGPEHSDDGGENGTAGGSSVLAYKTLHGTSQGNFYTYTTLLSCGGGGGGQGGDSSKSDGGTGGTNSLGDSTEAKSINLFANYVGKGGGQGGGKTHEASHPGSSFSPTIRVPLPIISEDPRGTNGKYGQGTDSYAASGSTHYGGGGGASLLSQSSGSSADGYGTGGHGGSYKNNSWWTAGADGTQGIFCVLTVN